ncbi:MAG TPA: DUF929 family protein [Chloroflexota bacterium]|nr:DUF929 family protein [Chloroflexota bacterium]
MNDDVNLQRVGPLPPPRYSRWERTRRYRTMRWLRRAVPIGLLLIVVLAVSHATVGGAPKPSAAPVRLLLGGVTDVVPPSKTGSFRRVSAAITQGHRAVFVYIGAQYSPYSAAEQWAVVKALSYFGRFVNLAITSSPAGSAGFGEIPTFDLYRVRYLSGFVDLENRQVANRLAAPLQHLNRVQLAWFNSFDPTASVPMVYVDGYVMTGAGYSPGLLQNRRFDVVQQALLDSGRVSYARAVEGESNLLAALVCAGDGGRPSRVCRSPVIHRIRLGL